MKIRVLVIYFILGSVSNIFALDSNNGSAKDEYKLDHEIVQKLLDKIETLESKVELLEQENVARENLQKKEIKEQSNNLKDDTQISDVFEVTNQDNLEQVPQQHKQEAKIDKDFYDVALANLKDKKFEIAEQDFAEFIKKFPKSKLLSNAYFWYGETFYRREMFNESAANYLKGYKLFPKGDKAIDSLMKLALSLAKLEKEKEACAIIRKLESEFPKKPTSLIKTINDTKLKLNCKPN